MHCYVYLNPYKGHEQSLTDIHKTSKSALKKGRTVNEMNSARKGKVSKKKDQVKDGK